MDTTYEHTKSKTKLDKIIMTQKGSDTDSNFIVACTLALDEIYSLPEGKRLLDDLNNATPAKMKDYVVRIHRAQQLEITHTWVKTHWWSTPKLQVSESRNAGWSGKTSEVEGNKAVRGDEKAAANGSGCSTEVIFNPNIVNPPDGTRPPHIGLAHELVHAWRNAYGNADMDTTTEEHQTVGLKPNTHGHPTENSIRAEHDWPLRTKYSGLE